MAIALSLEDVSKTFDGFRALEQARFVARAGEVHALIGENGAGKSTLMNVACGIYAPDSGTMRVFGAPARPSGPRAASALGVGMVHQHFKLVEPFTVLENVLLAERARGGFGFAARARAAERAIREKAALLGAEVDPHARVHTLSVGEQQRVEVIKALIGGARILILDEPTAVLTDSEAERLLCTLRALARGGTAVVLITHKLADVKRFADRVTIMRGGHTVAELDPADATVEEMTRLIVGDSLPPLPSGSRVFGRPRIEALSLSARRPDGSRALKGVSFHVRAGEIYGIAGISGNGQGELAEILMGLRAADAGALQFGDDGEALAAPSAARLREAGAAFIPADRYRFALVGGLSVADNYAIGGLARGRYGGWAWIDAGRMREDAAEAVKAFDVQGVRNIDQKAALLSGGNAQKLVISREFASAPKFVVAQSPSRGLDARAIAAVHARLRAAADAQAAVLLISEDLDEVLKLSDRIGVMLAGQLAGEFEPPFARQELGSAMVTHV